MRFRVQDVMVSGLSSEVQSYLDPTMRQPTHFSERFCTVNTIKGQYVIAEVFGSWLRLLY